jgi:hypothetical protein
MFTVFWLLVTLGGLLKDFCRRSSDHHIFTSEAQSTCFHDVDNTLAGFRTLTWTWKSIFSYTLFFKFSGHHILSVAASFRRRVVGSPLTWSTGGLMQILEDEFCLTLKMFRMDCGLECGLPTKIFIRILQFGFFSISLRLVLLNIIREIFRYWPIL